MYEAESERYCLTPAMVKRDYHNRGGYASLHPRDSNSVTGLRFVYISLIWCLSFAFSQPYSSLRLCITSSKCADHVCAEKYGIHLHKHTLLQKDLPLI